MSKRSHRFIDYTGKKFGMLTVLNDDSYIDRKVLCECGCGNKKRIAKRSLRDGASKSCGCLMKKLISEANSTHGLTKHPLYQTWRDMVRRCSNSSRKDYKHYGGRGIEVCDRWLDVSEFISDMYPTYKEGLELDRINNNGNYEPSNCNWVGRSKQCRNKRVRDDKGNLVEKVYCWEDLSDEYGIPAKIIQSRVVRLGWELERACTTPVKRDGLFVNKGSINVNLKEHMNNISHYNYFFTLVRKHDMKYALKHFKLDTLDVYERVGGDLYLIHKGEKYV